MDLATALHKRYRKGALLFGRIHILYSVLVQILLSSCEAVVPSCSLQYREKPETTWGDVNLIPRQNMRCGEKRVEIVTFRRGLLRIEVRSFTWLRRSSPRRKERFRVSSGDDLPKTLVCNLMHKGTLQISHKSRLLFCQLLILNLIEKQTRSIFKMYMSRPTKKGELSR